ncbi:MAG: PorT family protein, partial [Muribaculaceae bacterium]|nr:PorT family protein [Muribaculaceae bacterium]
MRFQIILKQILTAVLTMTAAVSADAQRYYSPNVSVGGKAGVTLSQMSFSPGIRQSMLMGGMAGVSFRYTEERNFGIIAELNVEQRGWKENFEDLPFQYQRTLTY